MFQWFSKLTTNQRLALLAFVLGAVAIGATLTRQGRVTVSPRDLGLIVQRGADHVTVQALADDLVKGQARYRIIDVRGEVPSNAYHLPGAENLSIAALPDAGLPKNERFLLYADDEVRAAQAWFLLKAEGYPAVYLLRGGLAAWTEQVLQPVLQQATTTEQRRENDQRAAVAAFFGGTPRPPAGVAAPATPAAPPVAVAPPAAPALQMPAGAAKPKAPVKKKEGC
jgi:rhodanese-related sulfurtransferase